MNLRRMYLFLLFTMLLALLFGGGEVNAMNTGFAVDSLPTKEKDTVISNLREITLIKEEPTKESIVCFDVNPSGLIAIGQSKFTEKTICIYSNDGIFQYGYTFDATGDFFLEWDGDNLNIYFVRGSIIASVTPDGEILDVFEVQSTTENRSYENNFIRATQKNIENHEYIIKNDMGIFNWIATSYSQIVVTDITGTEHVIYDVNAAQLSKMITISVLAFVGVSVVVVAIVRCCLVARGTVLRSKPKKETIK